MNIRNLLLTLAAAALTAFFLPPTLQSKGINVFVSYPVYYIYIAYIVLAVSGMVVASFLGKYLPVFLQLAKFGLVGVLNTAIDFGILNYLSTYTGVTSGLQVIPIKATSFSVALINSYFWNKGWVFEGKKKASPVTFAIVSVIGVSTNVGVFYTLTTIIGAPANISSGLWLNLSNVAATGVSLVWNYLGYRLIVFKR